MNLYTKNVALKQIKQGINSNSINGNSKISVIEHRNPIMNLSLLFNSRLIYLGRVTSAVVAEFA